MAERVKFKVKGHEKFPLREGWISKGIYAVEENSKVFNDAKATDILGVGSNMVKSIRYWMQAFELIDKNCELTEFARLIKNNDPFLEDYFTLWMLHSTIAKNVNTATSWYMFFNKFEAEEFSKSDVANKLNVEIKNYVGQTIPENSIKDDIDVLLNMYSRSNVHNDDPEDKIVCPLAALGLIKKDGEQYIKQQPDLRKVSDWVVLYEMSCLLNGKTSMSIDDIAYGDCSLGSIYNLSRVAVNQYLDRLENQGYIRVDRTAGLDMVYPVNVPSRIDVLRNYYN